MGKLAGKTRILCTHALQYLQDCDRVVIMHGGKITHGPASFEELVAAGVDFNREVTSEDSDPVVLTEVKEPDEPSKATVDDDEDPSLMTVEHRDVGVVRWERYKTYFMRMGRVAAVIWIGGTLFANMSPIAGRFALARWSELPHCAPVYGNASGCLKLRDGVWGADTDCCAAKDQAACADGMEFTQDFDDPCMPGVPMTICRVACGDPGVGRVATNGCCIAANTGDKTTCPPGFLADDDTPCPGGDHCSNNTCIAQRADRDEAMEWYRGSGWALLTLMIAANLGASYGRLKASKTLHEDMVTSVLRARVTAFFDATPLGRILNRFSTDMEEADTNFPQALSSFVTCVAMLLASVTSIVIATHGVCLLAFAPMVSLYLRFATYYRRTAIELKRLSSLAKSPTSSSFTETLAGVGSIRGYGAEAQFIATTDQRNTAYTNVQVARGFANYWLMVRMQAMSSVISGVVGAYGILTRGTVMAVPPSWVGLALLTSFEIPSILMHTVITFAGAEQAMNSVERITEYINDIPLEASAESATLVPDAAWPARGELKVSGLTMRYKHELPIVLDRVTFTVKPGQHCGVVGRTGSGKSSLMQAIFRIVEVEAGTISIDGVDISQMPLEVLRSRLAIISQDPVIYSTTVRENLDPAGTYSDDQVWEALKRCLMKESIEALPGKLASKVAERGESFSVGQRQLLCIARALLRQPKLLCLDEATASIDNESDAEVQEMIRTVFKSTTTLTIAHRLNTVLDGDLVMVMSAGQLVEIGPPQELLADANSALSALAAGS